MKKFHSHDISFLNDRDFKLTARLDLPEKPDYFAIFSPCFTCTKETLATYRISQYLAKYNIAVLRLDFTGLGDSEGDFADSNFSSMINDIVAANQYLQQHYQAASLLLGHSLGGTASYAAAQQLHNIKAIVSIASPSSPAHVTHHFGKALDQLHSGHPSEFYVAGKPYMIKPQFLQDLQQHHLQEIIYNLDKAILVFHGAHDSIVNIEHAKKIFANAKHPKSFVSLDSADHMLSIRDDAQYVADVIHSWSKRYLPG